ncbi:unknown [Bacteroides sp. CAG:144]|nr:unknown [Bacteroides sp. CAG:144]
MFEVGTVSGRPYTGHRRDEIVLRQSPVEQSGFYRIDAVAFGQNKLYALLGKPHKVLRIELLRPVAVTVYEVIESVIERRCGDAMTENSFFCLSGCNFLPADCVGKAVFKRQLCGIVQRTERVERLVVYGVSPCIAVGRKSFYLAVFPSVFVMGKNEVL